MTNSIEILERRKYSEREFHNDITHPYRKDGRRGHFGSELLKYLKIHDHVMISRGGFRAKVLCEAIFVFAKREWIIRTISPCSKRLLLRFLLLLLLLLLFHVVTHSKELRKLVVRSVWVRRNQGKETRKRKENLLFRSFASDELSLGF